MLMDKHDSLKGKRCLIMGSGKVARDVAKQLLEYGAIPLTFSDKSGHVYEPDGFQEGRLKNIDKIKNERGALLGRYIIQSTSAQYNEPSNLLDIPCDLIFPCAAMNDIDEEAVGKLADNGCIGVIEGGYSTVTQEARQCLKKRGLLYGPHTLTMTGPAVMNALGPYSSEKEFANEMGRIYRDVTNTAVEFHARGDLFQGANIYGFLRVANAMLSHGAV
jgi:glutamate dehydrogenase (NADP+)